MSTPVALIFGVGKNIGAHVARKFAENGYKVAVASRTPSHDLPEDKFLFTKCDASNPDSVVKVFEDVRSKLGHPSVVVYNAYSATPSPDRENPLSLPLVDVKESLEVNFSSPYVAAQQAVQDFGKLPEHQTKAFIFTGNRLNVEPIVPLMTLGIGKSATANLMAFLSKSYQKAGYKFHYADEREADGQPVYNRIDGPGHAEFFLQLAQGRGDIPWLATFVKGHGYKDFKEPLGL